MSANQYRHAVTFAASLAWFQLSAEKRRLMAATLIHGACGVKRAFRL